MKAMSAEVERYSARQLHLSQDGAARAHRAQETESAPGGTRRARVRACDSRGRPRRLCAKFAVGESITVADLAQKMAVKGADVVKALFKMGVMATINQAIDHDTAALVAEELGHKVVQAEEHDAETALLRACREARAKASRVRRW